MKPSFNHDWNISQAEAEELQNQLAPKIIRTDKLILIRFFVG